MASASGGKRTRAESAPPGMASNAGMAGKKRTRGASGADSRARGGGDEGRASVGDGDARRAPKTAKVATDVAPGKPSASGGKRTRAESAPPRKRAHGAEAGGGNPCKNCGELTNPPHRSDGCKKPCRVCHSPKHPFVRCDSADDSHIEEAKDLCGESRAKFKGRTNRSLWVHGARPKGRAHDPMRDDWRERKAKTGAKCGDFAPEKAALSPKKKAAERAQRKQSRLSDYSLLALVLMNDADLVRELTKMGYAEPFSCSAGCGAEAGCKVISEGQGHGVRWQCRTCWRTYAVKIAGSSSARSKLNLREKVSLLFSYSVGSSVEQAALLSGVSAVSTAEYYARLRKDTVAPYSRKERAKTVFTGCETEWDSTAALKIPVLSEKDGKVRREGTNHYPLLIGLQPGSTKVVVHAPPGQFVKAAVDKDGKYIKASPPTPETAATVRKFVLPHLRGPVIAYSDSAGGYELLDQPAQASKGIRHSAVNHSDGQYSKHDVIDVTGLDLSSAAGLQHLPVHKHEGTTGRDELHVHSHTNTVESNNRVAKRTYIPEGIKEKDWERDSDLYALECQWRMRTRGECRFTALGSVARAMR